MKTEVYLVISEYNDYYCPENNHGGYDDVQVFSNKVDAEKYMEKKMETRIKDSRSYWLETKELL